MHRTPLLIALAGLAALAFGAFQARGGFAGQGIAYALGALVGGLAGFGLYHAAFGFTAAWRRLVRERRGAGIRAQMLLIGATCLVTYPLIGLDDLTGMRMYPVILPMSLASALGAFIFGIGMQLGGGCASGTLYVAGGGSSRMLVTLAAFIFGSVAATAHMTEFWLRLDDITGWPTLPGFSAVDRLGTGGALAALAALIALICWATLAIERRAHGAPEPRRTTESLLKGPWSLRLGALVLATVGIASFLIFQRPWGITSGFALWGAKIADVFGVPVRDWGYWSGWRAGQLEQSLFADRISVMNFGILAGAMAAAALAGRFAPIWRLGGRDVLTALAGGLMMGYGARLAFGCNIGAYLGGLVSGSAHGIWWMIFGFAGSWIGTLIRERIGMDPPLTRSPAIPRPAAQ